MSTINNYPAELIERITGILAREQIYSHAAWEVLSNVDEKTGVAIYKAASKYPGFKLVEADGIRYFTKKTPVER